MSFSVRIKMGFTAITLLIIGCSAGEIQETAPIAKTTADAGDEFAVRHPAAQGFYPADAQELKAMLDDLRYTQECIEKFGISENELFMLSRKLYAKETLQKSNL